MHHHLHSLHLWLYQWEPLPSYIFGERRRDRTCNLLIRSQVVAFAIHPTDRSSPSCYILRYSYGMSFHSELAQEHSILYSIRAYDPVFELAFDSAFDFIAPRVYPFFLRPRYLITTNLFPLQLYNRFPSFYEYRLYIHTTVDIIR